ncbi:MAG: serine hydrolase [Eggerthellaceae bacterium]|nr:serine hydrolase [Eggerthellaceae bacterium]
MQHRSAPRQQRRVQATRQHHAPRYLRVLLFVLLAVLIVGIAFGISRCIGSQNDSSNATGRSNQSQSVNDKSTNADKASVLLTNTSMQRIPDDDGVFSFTLSQNASAPVLSDTHREAIEEAYDSITQFDASAGFLFIDLKTGSGIGCNVDEPIYAASAVKGLYACYLAEGQVDAGLAEWSEELSEDIAYSFMDENGEYLNDNVSEYSLESLVEDSVVRSENDAYRILRMHFDSDEYLDWLDNAGVDGSDWRFTDWWTNYSAREAAALWLHARNYVSGTSPSASKLKDWLGKTDVSMIRNVLMGAGESDCMLISKAGWNADMEEVRFNALGDAGIVSKDGKDYLIVVLSSFPGEDDTFYLAEDLIAALWSARTDLAS